MAVLKNEPTNYGYGLGTLILVLTTLWLILADPNFRSWLRGKIYAFWLKIKNL